jgi:hypothetical protein
MKNSSVLISFLSILFFVSCKKEIDNGIFSSGGILVVNEGLFQTGTGELSWIDAKTEQVQQNVFSLSNDGLLLGNVANSAAISSNLIFVAVNNAQRIVAADRSSFKYQFQIVDISQPRYMLVPNDSILIVTAWGDGFSGSLSKVNLIQRGVEKTISGLKGPEEAAVWRNELLVPSSGGFGTHNMIYRVDLENFNIVDSILVGDRPVKIVVVDNIPFLICSGKFSFLDPTLNTPGGLYRVSTNGADLLTELPNGTRGLCHLKEFESLFSFEGNTIYKYHLPTQTLSSFSSPATTSYALHEVTWNGKQYLAVCDAKDYISAGEIFLIDGNGNLVRRWNTGMIPAYTINL